MKLLVWCALVLVFTPGWGCSSDSQQPDGGTQIDSRHDVSDQNAACETLSDCPLHYLCVSGVCTQGTVCSQTEDCPRQHVCNAMSQVCVPREQDECQTDGDCRLDTAPYCLDGLCVECTASRHCQDTQECTEQHVCQSASWVDCQGDQECTDSAKPFCHPVEKKCMACVEDAHCPGSLVCQPTSNRCVLCYEHGHCSTAAAYCDTQSSSCVACLEDSHCTGSERCSRQSHTCTGFYCTQDQDCADQMNKVCLPQTGDCVECSTDVQCGSYAWCRGYECHEGCLHDADCKSKLGSDYHCNPEDQSCFFAQCLSDQDCRGNPNGEHCKLNEESSNPAQYSCVECTQDSHCAAGYLCTKGTNKYICEVIPCYGYDDPQAYCAQFDSCYECRYSGSLAGQCAPREKCNQVQGLECCQGYYCSQGSGSCELNDYCERDQDCPVGYTCNLQTRACEYVSCCDPDCDIDEFCDGNCVCVSDCLPKGELCNILNPKCCSGLTCIGICIE